MKKVLICGISGQDGAYLAKLLLDKGYQVYGGSRDAQMSSFSNLLRLGIKDNVHLVSINITDFRSVLQSIIKIQPDEIYNLAGQSSVGLSFEQPVETLESIAIGTLNLLESIRFSQLPIRFYNAGSSECFGDTGNKPADENTPFRPRSPYGVAKATAFWEVSNYREAYNIYTCTGILFNHESILRPERFVTQKIISSVKRIAKGGNEKLYLGNIEIQRDWGWAPEYVEAMWLMLQQEKAEDFVIATGQTNSLKDLVINAFESAKLDWLEFVELDTNLQRPTELNIGKANPQKAKQILGWEAKVKMKELVDKMYNSE